MLEALRSPERVGSGNGVRWLGICVGWEEVFRVPLPSAWVWLKLSESEDRRIGSSVYWKEFGITLLRRRALRFAGELYGRINRFNQRGLEQNQVEQDFAPCFVQCPALYGWFIRPEATNIEWRTSPV